MKNSLIKFLDQVHEVRVRLLVSLVGAGLLCGVPVGPVVHWLLAVFIALTALALSVSQTYRLHAGMYSHSDR
ncbi:hypothetical protein LFL96_36745 (plasmid) [Paraburkholderia sp. D15]|uniref:hypothetical protein n=1 Tax=Paraburkholderia sp. D15 TaxID=2880218 RepID=UPI00247A2F4D|nr:hypothetical protein [Paraburkholderia sp. D15]WGS55027.1 hypothetical protein LFL96_36745 [Paraburkholderia sp. D15]